jgi:hypothetical protein
VFFLWHRNDQSRDAPRMWYTCVPRNANRLAITLSLPPTAVLE